ncbi:MAG: hypothetical protein Q9186_004039 [Xanthomendoza sp. 1 TL-2023]
MPYIPSEILDLIFQHSNKTDLQNVRFACRQFNEIIIPYLYNELTLRLDITANEIAQRPSFTYGCYVKVLKIMIVDYANLTLKEYTGKIDRPGRYRGAIWDTRLAERSYERYNVLRIGHQVAMETGAMRTYVTSVIACMHNLRVILISDRVCRYPPSTTGTGGVQDYYPLPDDIDPYAVDPSSGFTRRLGAAYWSMLVDALAQAAARFTTLYVHSSHNRLGLRPALFEEITVKPLRQTADMMTRLTTLDLQLKFPSAHDHTLPSGATYYPAYYPALAKVLAQAVHLEILEVRIASDSGAWLLAVFDACKYPNLRVCILGNFRSTHAELLQFLTTPKKLTHLELNDHDIYEVEWEEVVEDLKISLPFLEHIRLDDYGEWNLTRIRDFFFRNGPNPFEGDFMKPRPRSSATEDHQFDGESGDGADLDEVYDSDDSSDDDDEVDWTGLYKYLEDI